MVWYCIIHPVNEVIPPLFFVYLKHLRIQYKPIKKPIMNTIYLLLMQSKRYINSLTDYDFEVLTVYTIFFMMIGIYLVGIYVLVKQEYKLNKLNG